MRVNTLFFFLFVFFLLACSERDLPHEVEDHGDPAIKIHMIPEYINPGNYFFVSVQVLHHNAVDRVQLSVYGDGQSEPSFLFSLYDDGGAEHPEDGDVVARDGFFSQRILWDPTISGEMEYTFSFQAIREEAVAGEEVETTVISVQKFRPQILNIEAPTLLQSGFEGTTMVTAQVYDSSGVENLKTVWFDGLRQGVVNFTVTLNDSGSNGDQNADDQIYSVALDKAFAAGKTGDYELFFYAENRSGAQSEPKTTPLRIENSAPFFLTVTAPDTVDRPQNNQVFYFPIKTSVDDPQTIQDIQLVQMKWEKPDGSYPQSGPYSELFDNGLEFDINKWNQGYRGDETAGDGVFTITGAFDERQPLGQYTLTFVVYDRVGQASDAWVHTIHLQ
jgi:hypothetical protein